MSASALAVPAMAVKGREDNVTICHRTNATTNPYRVITVDRSSVDGAGGQGDHFLNHVGPVWTPDQRNGGDWGDIIPPIPGFHGGLNWTDEGIAIYNNGCKPVADRGTPPEPQRDVDGDGTPDLEDPDDDNDGVPDVTDPDDDNDGVTDLVDPDHDDTDGDGTPDAQDPDDDNDGTPDEVDPDQDGDGTPDTTDPDDDNDGTPDTQDADHDDVDGDGTPDAQDPDDDNDGTPDTQDADDDNDGIRDSRDPDSPVTPVAVVAPDNPQVGETVVFRVSTVGRSTVKADCLASGKKVDRLCTVKVARSAVKVRAVCNDDVAIRVTAKATGNSMRTAEVRRTVKLARKPFVPCSIPGRG